MPVNEVHVCSYFVDEARKQLGYLVIPQDTMGDHDASVEGAGLYYFAARLSVTAALSALPKWATEIDGEDFWDRFNRLRLERENEADGSWKES
jgi:hypothetical protein